jgi:electron transfer flavoprotein alpha/beta subunit
MKAKKKPIEKLLVEDLGVDLTPRLEILKFQEPPKRMGGGKVISNTQSTCYFSEDKLSRLPTLMS